MNEEKVWLITGASRGFGYEIAKAALEYGSRVSATVRKDPESLFTKLAGDDRLLVTVLDVTNPATVAQSVKSTRDRFGRIDVLVNNAGYGLLGALEEVSDEEARQVFETNVFGLLNVTREVLPHMRKQRSGHILNLSSVGGIAGFAGWGLYCATKFAVEGLTESLALELVPFGIHATAVEPGFFRTNFLDGSSLESAKNIMADYDETVGSMRNTISRVNQHQPGSPEKLARALIKLSESKNPPVHLILGKDALNIGRQKLSERQKESEDWLDVTAHTDYDEA